MTDNQLSIFSEEESFTSEETFENSIEDEDMSKNVSSKKKYISSIWSFPGSGGNQLYRWYGTLPRPLLEQLLSLYTNSSSRVLDPFMGLGNTLDVVADKALRSIGIDTNPLACLASEAKLFGVPQRSEVMKKADDISKSANTLIDQIDDTSKIKWMSILGQERYKYTRKWFREESLIAMMILLTEISSQATDIRMQRAMFVSAAQTVREIASVDPRCTHHLVRKEKPFLNPVKLWNENLIKSLNAIRQEPADVDNIEIRQGSVLDINLEAESCDFVLLHPPYLGVIHYHLIHRLSTDLLEIVKDIANPVSLSNYNFDYADIRSKDMSTDNTEKYMDFVEKLAISISPVVAKDGRCAVIIGDQRYKGHLRHSFTDFIYHFEKLGFQLEENFIWVLQNNGGMHVLRKGNFIDHNYILVFHKA